MLTVTTRGWKLTHSRKAGVTSRSDTHGSGISDILGLYESKDTKNSFRVLDFSQPVEAFTGGYNTNNVQSSIILDAISTLKFRVGMSEVLRPEGGHADLIRPTHISGGQIGSIEQNIISRIVGIRLIGCVL